MDHVESGLARKSHENALSRAVHALMRCLPTGTNGIALVAETVDGNTSVDLMYTDEGQPSSGKSL